MYKHKSCGCHNPHPGHYGHPGHCGMQQPVYHKPCPQTKVINKYHVECEKVEVPVHTHVIHHKIKKPIFVPVPVCTEELKEHPYQMNDCCHTQQPQKCTHHCKR